MAQGIIVGGKIIEMDDPIPSPVLNWHDLPAIEFRAGEGYNKRRTEDINLVVWHWTGGENDPERMIKVLKKRKLGIEFSISRLGVIHQHCDPMEVDTADAASYNRRSVGIEMVNYGFRRKKRLHLIPKLGLDRAVYETTMRGRKRKFASFYPWQLKAAFQLADALSVGLDIPSKTFFRDFMTGPNAPWSGHIGHYQISNAKSDPGTLFMAELQAHFEGKA